MADNTLKLAKEFLDLTTNCDIKVIYNPNIDTDIINRHTKICIGSLVGLGRNLISAMGTMGYQNVKQVSSRMIIDFLAEKSEDAAKNAEDFYDLFKDEMEFLLPSGTIYIQNIETHLDQLDNSIIEASKYRFKNKVTVDFYYFD